MESVFQKVINFPSHYIVIVLITFFYTLEYLQSSDPKFKDRFDHLFNNLLFYIAVVVLNYLFALLLVFGLQWASDHHLGLLNYWRISFIVKTFLGIVCFDFTAYWFHRLAHIHSFLWRLHRVHHSDTNMDASTFFRHHPFEIIVTGASALVAGVVFGLDENLLAIYVSVLIPWMIFQHSNIKFSPFFDNIFGILFATPNFHKLHHSQDQLYTDSNYADLFIIWDKLFGTFQPYHSTEIEYGLKEFCEEEKQSFWFLVKSPFVKLGSKKFL